MRPVRRLTSVGLAGFVAVILLSVAASGSGSQGAAKSIRDGVYTKAQADRGGSTFAAICIACHADPKFAQSVIDNADGTPAADVFAFMKTAMPEDNPGSLRPEEYAELLAYFISSRGLPPGAADLPSDVDALKQIRIEKPLE